MQPTFNSMRTFDYAQATVHLWIFKKTTAAQRYKAHFVQTDEGFKNVLKSLIRSEMERVTEFGPYTHLAQNNENSCLSISRQDTDFVLLKAQVDRLEPECAIQGVGDLKGADGYVVKYHHNYDTVYAVKRSTQSWKTSYPKKLMNLVFKNGELSAAEDDCFTIERNFDFISKGDFIFITNKRGFESTTQHRAGYSQAFATLQQNPTFSALFSDVTPLVQYVGTNTIQLRRMATVEQKALYAQPSFLPNLRRVCTSRNWEINFGPDDKIVPCEQTAKAIVQVLLDHRLISEVTNNMYDVPDATQI